MQNASILIVDDDKDIVNLVGDILEDEGYTVYKCYDGKNAIKTIKEKRFDLILLDIMLPDIDGLEVCKKVRDEVTSPIILLTAKNKNFDKVLGLELGADDYISKPFDDNELLARVKAHLRRQKRIIRTEAEDNVDTIKYQGLKINRNSFEVEVDGHPVELSTREFQILLYLAENSNIVLSREQIYDGVWGYEEYGDINTVTVHIKKLREKVDRNDKYIKTVWGTGYKFVGDK